jgi:branched-chain amino acid transport system substrate-binding protein
MAALPPARPAGSGLIQFEENTMTSRTLRALAGTGLLTAALVAAGCGAGGPDELVIGVYGSLTGNDATFGQSTRNGMELALAELQTQKQGRIGGLPLRLIVEDDQGRPEEAATVVQKLVNQDRVAVVVGEVASSRSLAAAPICQQAGVPMITPSSTNPAVTQKGDFIFRMCYIDPFQGLVMARFAAEDLKLQRVAILKDVRNDYSVGLAGFFTTAFQARGGSIVIEQSYSAGDQDFRAQLTAIKGRAPQAIFVPGYYTDVGLIARQARELGITVPLLGGDGWESEQLIAIGGEAMNGCYYSNHFAVDNPDPALQSFLKAYQARFGTEPDAMAGLAYDAGRVLFGALGQLAEQEPSLFRALGSAKAGTPERTTAQRKLRDLVAATTNFPGVTGNITLDADRNAKKPAVVIGIEAGHKKYATTINP